MTPATVPDPNEDPFGLKPQTPLLVFTGRVAPAIKQGFGGDWLQARGATMLLELRMGGKPNVMRGQGLDAEGYPCPDGSVKLVDETLVTDG